MRPLALAVVGWVWVQNPVFCKSSLDSIRSSFVHSFHRVRAEDVRIPHVAMGQKTSRGKVGKEVYDQIVGPYVKVGRKVKIAKFHKLPVTFAMAEALGTSFKNKNQKNVRVLEIGSGIGETTLILQRGFAKSGLKESVVLTGLEISETSYRIAKARTKKNINYLLGDIAEKKSLPQTKFDAIVGIYSPFNYASTHDQLVKMFDNVFQLLKSKHEAFFILNVLTPETQANFQKKSDYFEIFDPYGVVYTTAHFVKSPFEPTVVHVRVFYKKNSVTFLNYVWSEQVINEILKKNGAKYKWIRVSDPIKMPGYEKTQFNRVLLFEAP